MSIFFYVYQFTNILKEAIILEVSQLLRNLERKKKRKCMRHD